jgi:hypothetical protein
MDDNTFFNTPFSKLETCLVTPMAFFNTLANLPVDLLLFPQQLLGLEANILLVMKPTNRGGTRLIGPSSLWPHLSLSLSLSDGLFA